MIESVSQKYKKSVKNIFGADVKTDHTLLLLNVRKKRCRNSVQKALNKPIRLGKLKNSYTLEQKAV